MCATTVSQIENLYLGVHHTKVILGIIVDTYKMEVCLPVEKIGQDKTDSDRTAG